MRINLTNRLAAFSAAGFLLFGFSSPAMATGPVGSVTGVSKAVKSNGSPLTGAIHSLQQIKVSLEKADHDYGGHRAKAIHDISEAEHELRAANHAAHQQGKKPASSSNSTTKTKPAAKPANNSNSGGGNKGKMTEPQPLSDAQIAAAIPELQAAESYLRGAGHDFGGHKEKAIQDLNKAIGQLKEALAYIKKKEAGAKTN
jgi:hypothetical protein